MHFSHFSPDFDSVESETNLSSNGDDDGHDLPRVFNAVHRYWRDRVVLFPQGRFRRATTHCQGSWEEHGNGDLLLKWDEWEPELLARDTNGYRAEHLLLHQVSSSQIRRIWLESGEEPAPIDEGDQGDGMRGSRSESAFCGMLHHISDPAPPKEVVVFEGFFNRLNGLVNGLLIHGPEFRVRWGINRHLPHRFDELFDPIPGLEVAVVEDLNHWHQNADPAYGPLCSWFVSRRCVATSDEVRDAYRYFTSKLKVEIPVPDAAVGIHYRGLHHSSSVAADEFAQWCVDQMAQRNQRACFVLADSGREEIQRVLAESGITVTWGRAAELTGDLDRSSLDELRQFIGDALALAECPTVLTSFDESTIADPARAFGREVVACAGSRAWCDCWFHHSL